MNGPELVEAAKPRCWVSCTKLPLSDQNFIFKGMTVVVWLSKLSLKSFRLTNFSLICLNSLVYYVT